MSENEKIINEENTEVNADKKKRAASGSNASCIVAAIVAVVFTAAFFIQSNQLKKLDGIRDSITLEEEGSYNDMEDVAAYIYKYHHLPSNYVDKGTASLAGWEGGPVRNVIPGASIGGDRFYGDRFFEEYSSSPLPRATGRFYRECDVNSDMIFERGFERLLYSNDGLVYYTPDHYKTFRLIYGQP